MIGTHGRIKWRKKSFYKMKKAAYANLICYRLKRFRKEKVLIYQGVPGTKKGDFEGGRSIYRPRQKLGSNR